VPECDLNSNAGLSRVLRGVSENGERKFTETPLKLWKNSHLGSKNLPVPERILLYYPKIKRLARALPKL
jgi:hypothetical protein